MIALLDQLIHLAARDLGTIRGKVRFVGAVAPHLRRVSDPTERESYIVRIAGKVNLPVDTIRDAVS